MKDDLGELVGMPRPRTIVGVAYILAGVLIAANGLVSGPHAFRGRWSAVILFVIVGLLLVGCGAKMLRRN